MTKPKKLTLGQYRNCDNFGPEYTLIQEPQDLAKWGEDYGFCASEFGNLLMWSAYDEHGNTLTPREIWGTRSGVAWLWSKFELLWLAEPHL